MTILSDALTRFFSLKDPVVFTGAGVSAYAGVPTWNGLLVQLTEWIRSRDPLTANQMAEAIHEGDYIAAADYFFLSRKATEGEKLKTLVERIEVKEYKKLIPLMRLPFKAFLTTNFDRGLLDAYAAANSRSAIDFRRGDDSFKETLWCMQPYVTRIHGGVESPTSIVLSSEHFRGLEKDSIYQDILTDFFTRKNILFLGCSFTDPAIRRVFEYVNKLYGPTPSGLHMALVPEDVGNDFITRLNRMNVEVIRYDPKNQHKQLWDELEHLSRNPIGASTASPQPVTEKSLPFRAAKQYLASCYARMRLSGKLHPLRQAVVEGIVSSVIQSKAPKGVPIEELTTTVHEDLGINQKDARTLVEGALDQLAEERLCLVQKNGGSRKVSWIGEADDINKLDQAIQILVRNIVDRAVVQEGMRSSRDMRDALNAFLRDLVLQRGWDLGASFAANKPLADVDIEKLLYKSCTFLSHMEIEKLKRICLQLITAPTEEEATVLSELGRASFVLELAVNTPRNILFHSTVLPQKVYLDANVLLPALTYGHPYHQVYTATIDRLREASNTASARLQIIAYKGFLNEVVSHRKLAIQEIDEWGLDYKEGIVKEALLYGTANMNVFVGAYANVVQTENLEFSEFLNKYASFTSEADLKPWLRHRGILVLDDKQMQTSVYPDISLELQKAYADSLEKGKEIRLIEHDAVQLSSLFTDGQKGERSILVTADKRLREMVEKGKYKALGEHMISNVGLTQLIDLLVGNVGESRGLASLIWTARSSSKAEEVRQYLVSLALREYDEAMAMELPHIVEQIAEEIVEEAARKGIDFDTENARTRRNFLQVVGTYEDKFFSAIRERIDRREKHGKDLN